MTDAVLETAVMAARAAGELQRRGRAEGVRLASRTEADITTEVDLACERAITALVRARHPDHGIVGEEGASIEGSSGWVWLVDPLDGTKNYAHGSLRCGVSIAVQRDGETVAAAVYAPFVDELYTATQHGGARCNDVAIHVSPTTSLRDAMVATAVTYDGRAASASQLTRVVRVFGAVQALRSLGCAALDLCDVARGRLDAYFEPGLKPWDTAAGALVVREAGGAVTRFDGTAHTPDAPDMVATNGRLHGALRELVGA